MKKISILTRSVFAFAATVVAGSALAQTVPVVYTDGQAGGGKSAYAASCESCHGDTLQGLLEAPALSGPRFVQTWKGGTVKDLYDFAFMYMPQDKPSTLSPQTYADIIAYILQFNKVPAGDKPLDGPPPANMIIPK